MAAVALMAAVNEQMEPLVKVYEEYCANYKRAKDKLNALIQDPIFCTFIEVRGPLHQTPTARLSGPNRPPVRCCLIVCRNSRS